MISYFIRKFRYEKQSLTQNVASWIFCSGCWLSSSCRVWTTGYCSFTKIPGLGGDVRSLALFGITSDGNIISRGRNSSYPDTTINPSFLRVFYLRDNTPHPFLTAWYGAIGGTVCYHYRPPPFSRTDSAHILVPIQHYNSGLHRFAVLIQRKNYFQRFLAIRHLWCASHGSQLDANLARSSFRFGKYFPLPSCRFYMNGQLQLPGQVS
jgi:hypothetical protein